MFVLCATDKATPCFGMVPNPDSTGPNWLAGLWMVWAERDLDSGRWVYCYTCRENTFFHSGQGCRPSTFKTKREALEAGRRYVGMVYHGETAKNQAPETFLAIPGPFQREA